MERAVGELAAQHFAQSAHAPLAQRIFRLHHQAARPHAEQHTVAPAIKGQGRLLQHIFSGGRAGSQEAGAHPFQQVVGSDIVGANDQHAAAAAGPDPVLGHAHCHGGRGAGGVDLGVGTADAEQLRKLRVTHRENAEEETAIELVALAAGTLGEETRDLVDQVVVAWEGRGEDHAGFVGHGDGKPPAVGQVAAGSGAAIVAYQRNPRIAQRLDARGDGQRRGDVPCLHSLARYPEFLDHIEGAAATGQANNLVYRLDGIQAGFANLALNQANHILLQHAGAEDLGYGIDEGIAPQDAFNIAVVEDVPILPGQAQGRARHDNRSRTGLRQRRRTGAAATVERHALVEKTGKQSSQPFVVGLACANRTLTHGLGYSLRKTRTCGGHWCGDDGLWVGPRTCKSGQQILGAWYACGVEAAHGIVEGTDAAAFGMIGGKADDVVFVVENAFRQGHERAFGPDLNENARPLPVAGLDALDELDRGRHLVSQAAPDGVHVVGRVELAIDVAHQRNARECDLHLADGAIQRIRRGRHHLAVEGVGYWDELRDHAQLVEVVDRAVYRIAGTRDHGLLAAVDVGRREVAADLGQPAHDFVSGPRHRGHRPRTRTYRHQGFGEGDHAGTHSRGPFAQAVPHHHVGDNPMLVKQAHDGDVAGHHRRLADGGVLQGFFGRLHGGRIGLVLVDVAGERLTQNGAHHAIGLGESLAHYRVWHIGQHVHIL